MSFEGVDQREAKLIEDSRLAGYIEKSTRYVPFTEKVEVDSEGRIIGPAKPGETGHYLYREYPEVQGSKLGSQYVEVMDMLIETVKAFQEPVFKLLVERLPLEEQCFTITVNGRKEKVKYGDIGKLEGIEDPEKEKELCRKAHERAIKAKILDLTRGPLPASLMTNIGMYASFRTYEHQVLKQRAEDYPPIRQIAEDTITELRKISEPLIARADSEHGRDMVDYLKRQRQDLAKLAQEVKEKRGYPYDIEKEYGKEEVNLLTVPKHGGSYEVLNTKNLAVATLYPHSDMCFEELRLLVDTHMSNDQVNQIIRTAVAGSNNRRYKPPRSFERPRFDFEWVGNFGIFRDLQRNRFTLQVRQPLTTALGYDMPQAIVDSGMEGKFKDAMEAVDALHYDMLRTCPAYAETVTTFAHKVRWLATMDLRQAIWMLQLRTGIQGHPDYRNLMQKSYKQLRRGFPEMVNEETMPHVDLNAHELERLAAAHSTEQKLAAMEE